MKSYKEFKVRFDGDIYDSNTIPASELAESLMALSELVEETNTITNQSKANITLKVKAHDSGSFEVVLYIYQQMAPILEQIKSVFNSYGSTDNIIKAGALITLIIGTDKMKGGLLGLIEWVKNRKITVEDCILDNGENGYLITTEDLEKKKITKFELDLFRSIKIRKSLETIITKRLQTSAQKVEFSYMNNSKKISKIIDTSHAEYFKALDKNNEDKVIESEEKMEVTIISPVFKKDNKWRFDDGINEFHAMMMDENFLNKVKNKDSVFADGDIFIIKRKKTQTLTSSGVLKTKYEIIEVINHESFATQLKIPFN